MPFTHLALVTYARLHACVIQTVLDELGRRRRTSGKDSGVGDGDRKASAYSAAALYTSPAEEGVRLARQPAAATAAAPFAAHEVLHMGASRASADAYSLGVMYLEFLTGVQAERLMLPSNELCSLLFSKVFGSTFLEYRGEAQATMTVSKTASP